MTNETQPTTETEPGIDPRNDTWENNQKLITKAIADCMFHYDRLPTKTEIAEKTGLSRNTIYKHLREYATHPVFKEREHELGIMTSQMMAKLFAFAMHGNVKAARLYFQMVGSLASRDERSKK